MAMPSEWAIKKTDEIIECWDPRDSISPLIEEALDAARAQGRREGLEEAAGIVEKRDGFLVFSCDADITVSQIAKIIRTRIQELIRAAREALELREALEFAADVSTTLVKESDGSYSCWRTDAWGEVHQYSGATPLKAINKARRGM